MMRVIAPRVDHVLLHGCNVYAVHEGLAVEQQRELALRPAQQRQPLAIDHVAQTELERATLFRDLRLHSIFSYQGNVLFHIVTCHFDVAALLDELHHATSTDARRGQVDRAGLHVAHVLGDGEIELQVLECALVAAQGCQTFVQRGVETLQLMHCGG